MKSPSDSRPPRVALVTPSFWPVSNHLLASVLGLAEGWSASGAEVSIVTERLEPSWSNCLRFCDYEVVRVDRPSSRAWGRGRFAKILVKALQEKSRQADQAKRPWDVVQVCAWPEALFALQEAAGLLTDRLIYWFDRPFLQDGRRLASLRAWKAGLEATSALLSPHPLAGRWLTELGIDCKPVEYFPDCYQSARSQSPLADSRPEARKTLAEIHPLLNFERQQVVALCAAELSNDEGFFDLLAAWRMLRREEPRAQLLIIGEGPLGRAVWQRIHDWHLQGNVVMPGCFDDLSELFRAVDFFVHPLRNEQSCPFLTAALGSGKACVVSSASPWAGQLQPGREVWSYPAGNVSELSACLSAVVGNPGAREEVGRAAAAAVESRISRERQVERLRSLLQDQALENLGASL